VTGVAVELTAAADLPAPFRQALDELVAVTLRPEVSVRELPAPQRLAPYAVALHASVDDTDGEALAEGRLIVLHDPDGQDVWEGDTRCVAYLQADVEPEVAADPMLLGVGWSWLLEALETAGADHRALGGTVTRTASERFGALADSPMSADVELRASWSPVAGLAPHLLAFGDLLCVAAGLPPTPPGVTPLPAGRRRRRSR
jgi:hypothetical protein